MLHQIAAKHMTDRLARRVGPEDVVQSACRTFFRRVQVGQLQLNDSESLWRLLCAITLTKIREQARYHSRQKRGMNQEVPLAADPGNSSALGFQPIAPGPSPVEEVAFTDQFEQLLGSLDEEERQIVDLKLQELTHEEVAQRLGISERTVRRLFKRIQSKLTRVFDDSI
jgi:RNA polymerase sigma factor (sigma-70 family)